MSNYADWIDDVMEFDHVIMVRADGTADTHPEPHVYAPESVIGTDDDGQIMADDERAWRESLESQGWETVTDGYSGQHGYSGPIMHASEYIGGYLAEDIVRRPGLYVLVSVACLPVIEDGESELAGWTVLHREVPFREPGYFRCPCCGDDVITADGTDLACDDCEAAQCERTWDASGDLGWYNCQRPDRDAEAG